MTVIGRRPSSVIRRPLRFKPSLRHSGVARFVLELAPTRFESGALNHQIIESGVQVRSVTSVLKVVEGS
jgi:hypothetical protein